MKSCRVQFVDMEKSHINVTLFLSILKTKLSFFVKIAVIIAKNLYLSIFLIVIFCMAVG